MNEQQGWIKIHRKILDWEWYTDANIFRVFMHLIFTANHSPKKWRGKALKSGDLVTSVKSLASQLELSEKQIRTALSKLEKTGEIKKKGANKFTLITVENYEIYQGFSDEESQSKVNQRAIKSQTKVNQRATNNNDNNKKNEKNDKNIIIKAEKNAEIPFKEIIDYLNEKAEKKYRVVDSVKSLIKKRFSEGFTLEDFKTVIDVKCSKWKDDEKMNPYLRPETLFGNKFQNYLNEQPAKNKSSYDIEKAIKQAEEGAFILVKNSERRKNRNEEESNSSAASS